MKNFRNLHKNLFIYYHGEISFEVSYQQRERIIQRRITPIEDEIVAPEVNDSVLD
jgi:hypothetical protein